MKLMSMKQYGKMTKASLVRKITKALKKLPKRTLVKMCYELEKRKLPTISTTKKGMPRLTQRRKAYIRKRTPKAYERGSVLYGLRNTPRHRKQALRRKTRKPRRLVKGSPEAKRYMAKIRRMRR